MNSSGKKNSDAAAGIFPLNTFAYILWQACHKIYAKATVDMKRKAAEKLGEDAKSVFKDDVAFKYADNDEVLKILCGLK